MFTTGLVIFLGLAFILAKLPRRLMLRALHHDMALDLLVSAVVLMVHFGTFSGLAAATVAGLLTSIATSSAKRLFGSHDGKNYKPGIFHVAVR